MVYSVSRANPVRISAQLMVIPKTMTTPLVLMWIWICILDHLLPLYIASALTFASSLLAFLLHFAHDLRVFVTNEGYSSLLGKTDQLALHLSGLGQPVVCLGEELLAADQKEPLFGGDAFQHLHVVGVFDDVPKANDDQLHLQEAS